MGSHASRWTHPSCDDCWFLEHHTDLPDGGLRIEMPHRIVERDENEAIRTWEQCCLCGAMTYSGIYIRRDPATLDVWCGQSEEGKKVRALSDQDGLIATTGEARGG